MSKQSHFQYSFNCRKSNYPSTINDSLSFSPEVKFLSANLKDSKPFKKIQQVVKRRLDSTMYPKTEPSLPFQSILTSNKNSSEYPLSCERSEEFLISCYFPAVNSTNEKD
ncbi:hypothetical protein TNCT_595061 [Trichonephila clavata]|uniref:Uncharacterized protein n=1 Tax=Trichonephila clavata TaxID=2740835 RepID=A0A8X6HJR2_TRICU|nr:hypothetical protein TNCT_595061 [Trichonephila clavata]